MLINIQELIIKSLRRALSSLNIESSYSGEIIIEPCLDTKFGDFSSSLAMKLAKPLKKPPLAVAAQIIEAVKEDAARSGIAPYLSDIKAEGAGFINFYLCNQYFYDELSQVIRKQQEALKIDLGKSRRVLVEFVSANPTGALSVAHARQAAVGDSLANILDFMGFAVQREYYLNDEGNQINILGKSVELRARELKGEKVEFPENYYQGDYIYDIAKAGAGKSISDPGEFAGEYILNIIKKELDDFGVHFDCWYSQKELTRKGLIEQAFIFLKKNNFIYEQEGALWFKSTAFGDDKDRVVIKSDGAFTYLAPDIAYHQDKFKRGFSWLINLWGPDHHGYIPRIRAAVQAFGYPEDSLSVVIVQLATIFRDSKPVQMSTRKGQYITLREVLDEVGKDASRFFFCMRKTSSHLDFDLEVAKKQTPENPVYYVQYAHARICSILNSSPIKLSLDPDLNLLQEKEELDLVKKILQMPIVLSACVATVDPYLFTIYLQELAESFHRFYDRHRVLGVDPGLTQARMSLIYAVKITLACGLKLLGVSFPEKM